MHSLILFVLRLIFVLVVLSVTSAQQDDSTATSCPDPTIVTVTTTTTADVVIVGAGISGLSAFVELKRIDPNVTVVIVEATDRMAGRMKKTTFGGMTIELGANWLHNKGSIWL